MVDKIICKMCGEEFNEKEQECKKYCRSCRTKCDGFSVARCEPNRCGQGVIG
ncbi:hypothetical protein KAR91_81870 [Candidatus Pacearchaeota archaeon]|nr:hypothetical protein [Candidatus Pacearchaeota archaeon]